VHHRDGSVRREADRGSWDVLFTVAVVVVDIVPNGAGASGGNHSGNHPQVPGPPVPQPFNHRASLYHCSNYRRSVRADERHGAGRELSVLVSMSHRRLWIDGEHQHFIVVVDHGRPALAALLLRTVAPAATTVAATTIIAAAAAATNVTTATTFTTVAADRLAAAAAVIIAATATANTAVTATAAPNMLTTTAVPIQTQFDANVRAPALAVAHPFHHIHHGAGVERANHFRAEPDCSPQVDRCAGHPVLAIEQQVVGSLVANAVGATADRTAIGDVPRHDRLADHNGSSVVCQRLHRSVEHGVSAAVGCHVGPPTGTAPWLGSQWRGDATEPFGEHPNVRHWPLNQVAQAHVTG
jgi:hypothetical protein